MNIIASGLLMGAALFLHPGPASAGNMPAGNMGAVFSPKYFPGCYGRVAPFSASPSISAKGGPAMVLRAETAHFLKAAEGTGAAQACYGEALDATLSARRAGRPAAFVQPRMMELRQGLAMTARIFDAAEDRFSTRSMKLNAALASRIAPAARAAGGTESKRSAEARAAMSEAHEALKSGNRVHEKQMALERKLRQAQ